MCFIITFSKKKFYPLNPRVKDVDIADIAHSLSNTCRYAGHPEPFFGVAQHSVLVSYGVARRYALWGLLHDASEAYVSDVSTPVKHLPEMAPYRRIERNIMRVIAMAFDLEWPEPAAVKIVDRLLLRTEAEDLGLLTPEWECYNEPRLDIKISPWATHEEGEEAFLKRFLELVSARGKEKCEALLLHTKC
jgi:hypothetical protein